MSLLDRARADMQQITTDENGFSAEMTFSAPDQSTKTVRGLHSKHHLSIDGDGRKVNSKNSHVSFAEAAMTGYPVRDANAEVNLQGHTVAVRDSTGTLYTYAIQQWFPDETLGLIVCILGDIDAE